MIRRSTTEDLERISELRYEMFQEIGTEDLLAKDFQAATRVFYSEQYEMGHCIHAVYEEDSQIIACAGGIIRSDIFLKASFKNDKYGYIMDVYVLPSYRRKGIAHDLVLEVLKWFEGMDLSSVKLDASKLSGALYAKIGFHSSIQMTLSSK